MVETQLTLIWTGIVGFAVFMYVLMDGFDLGLGILFPFAPSDRDRDIMMNSVAPIWDFNETWLVLGGAGLFAAFPLAYAIVLPALYLPLLAMLIALIFRGVAFEFRFKANRSRFLWNIAFNLGSLVATFVQGAAAEPVEHHQHLHAGCGALGQRLAEAPADVARPVDVGLEGDRALGRADGR